MKIEKTGLFVALDPWKGGGGEKQLGAGVCDSHMSDPNIVSFLCLLMQLGLSWDQCWWFGGLFSAVWLAVLLSGFFVPFSRLLILYVCCFCF